MLTVEYISLTKWQCGDSFLFVSPNATKCSSRNKKIGFWSFLILNDRFMFSKFDPCCCGFCFLIIDKLFNQKNCLLLSMSIRSPKSTNIEWYQREMQQILTFILLILLYKHSKWLKMLPIYFFPKYSTLEKKRTLSPPNNYLYFTERVPHQYTTR